MVVLRGDSPMIKAETVVRSEIYFWLSAIYASELNSEQIESYFTDDAQQTSLQHMASEPHLAPLFANLLDALNEKRYKFGALDLASEFCQLFLGDSTAPYANRGSMSCNPLFEQSFQRLTTQINLLYNGSEVEPPEPADHLSLQLAYLGHIVRLPEASTAMTTKFMRHQVLNWLPTFAEEINNANVSNFYSALAKLTVAWLETDLKQQS